MNFTHVEILIRRSFIFHPIPMKFWLKTPNNIYKNWMNSHIDRIMFTVSKLEISFGTIQLEHPVYIIHLIKGWVFEVRSGVYICIKEPFCEKIIVVFP